MSEQQSSSGRPQSLRRLRHLFAIFFLAFALIVTQPKPAHALIVFDPSAAAHWVIQLADNILSKLQRAAASVTNIMAHKVLGLKVEKSADVIKKQSVRNLYAEASARNVEKNAMLDSTKTCENMEQSAAEADAQSGDTAHLQALMAAQQGKNKKRGDPGAPAEYIKRTCGFRDTRPGSPQADLLRQMGCTTAPPFGGRYIDADLNIGSVVDYEEYRLPASGGVDPKGNEALPDPAQITDEEEMKFVAASYFCQSFRPQLPRPPQGTRTLTSDDIETTLGGFRGQSRLNLGLHACDRAISERTAIGETAAAKTAELKRLHDAQVRACTQMHNQGILTDGEYTSCQTNGMSTVRRNRLTAYKFGREKYLQYLAQHQQIAPDRVTELQNTYAYQAQNAFEDRLQNDKNALYNALASMPAYTTASDVNPTARGIGGGSGPGGAVP